MTARTAATWCIQNSVVACEYFSAFPTDAAKRRSEHAIRAIASSTLADSVKYTHATRR
jgi:hypothetical protein